MQRLEMTTALLSPTKRSSEETRRALVQRERERTRAAGIEIEDDDDEERFLTALQEKLLAHMDFLDHSFLVLRAKQINYVALRLHEALEPKRDDDTQLIQAWTIQPQSQLKIKMSTHIQVLKLSTIFREVQCLRLHQQSGLRTAIEMEIFPSLRSIEVLQTQITALRHVHFFARQLRFLHIEQTNMDELWEILSPLLPQSQSKSQQRDSAANDDRTPVAWRRLETLEINCCALRAVDATVNQLQVVKRLDLGWNRIERFDVVLTTTTLKVLHLCHNELRAVPPIARLRRLRELDLSVNKIASLCGVEALASLEVLDVSHNQISSMADVERLVQLRKLQRLVLQHNPIAQRPDYRREVLFFLGDGVELDRQAWSASELESMQHSRQLRSPSLASSDWGDAPSLAPSVAANSSSNSRLVKSPDRFVLSYPVLPACHSSMTPHLVEIRHAPSSSLSPQRQPQQLRTSTTFASRTASSSRISTIDDNSEASILPIDDDDDDASRATRRAPFRTVDDFFTTQSDFIVVLDTHLVDARVEHTDSSDGDSDTSESETGRRSRKYTTSDFMRDFEEEEELLIRDGATTADVRMAVPRVASAAKRWRQLSDSGVLSVRVLLSAAEARRYDLLFGIDGVPATLELQPHAIVESIRPSDRETSLRIRRPLADVVAIGASIHSSRAKIVTLKLRTSVNSPLLDVTYQIESAGVLERVLAAVLGFLHYQHSTTAPPVVCVSCAHCGAMSHLSREYIAHVAPLTPLASSAADPLVVYACLLCSSYNVRETAFDKMVAAYAADGVALSAKRTAAAPVPEQLADDGFYIEEHEPSAAEAANMYECVLIASHGVREVMASTAVGYGVDDIPNDAREEAVVQAMRMQ